VSRCPSARTRLTRFQDKIGEVSAEKAALSRIELAAWLTWSCPAVDTFCCFAWRWDVSLEMKVLVLVRISLRRFFLVAYFAGF